MIKSSFYSCFTSSLSTPTAIKSTDFIFSLSSQTLNSSSYTPLLIIYTSFANRTFFKIFPPSVSTISLPFPFKSLLPLVSTILLPSLFKILLPSVYIILIPSLFKISLHSVSNPSPTNSILPSRTIVFVSHFTIQSTPRIKANGAVLKSVTWSTATNLSLHLMLSGKVPSTRTTLLSTPLNLVRIGLR